MDYVSQLLITDKQGKEVQGTTSMNKIFTHQRWRFYQTSYDEDGCGSILSISHDPYGIGITYAGYLLLLVSWIGLMMDTKGGFRRLLRHPALRRGTMMVALLLSMGGAAHATDDSTRPSTLPCDVAEEFGNLYVYYNDRVCPLQTLAKDFTQKLYGKDHYRGYTATQVLLGWFFYYDEWKIEPMIKIKGDGVGQLLGIEGKYAALTDFVNRDGYKLAAPLRDERYAALRSKIEAANEKCNLAGMLASGTLLRIYPVNLDIENSTLKVRANTPEANNSEFRIQNSKLNWYSPADRLPSAVPYDQWQFILGSLNLVAEQVARHDYATVSTLVAKIRKYQESEMGNQKPTEARFTAEKIYNHTNYNRPLAMACATFGILLFVGYLMGGSDKRMELLSIIRYPLSILNYIIFVYLTLFIALRGYISNHFPLSNGYETMQFMAWCSMLMTILWGRRFALAVPFGYLLCGLTLLVAMMGEANPKITQLMPVLQSPLLSIHVAVIMVSYVLFAFTMLTGITAEVLHHRGNHQEEIEALAVTSRLLLYPAVALLSIGIFIGAVWANISWGRYWGWDPKEVWALITMLIYAAPLHCRSLSSFARPMTLHRYCIVAFLSVLVTYFGVNYLLGGMHSYA